MFPRTVMLQRGQRLRDQCGRRSGGFHRHQLSRATAQCFDAQSTGSRKQIEHAGIVQHSPRIKVRENRLFGAIRGRPGTRFRRSKRHTLESSRNYTHSFHCTGSSAHTNHEQQWGARSAPMIYALRVPHVRMVLPPLKHIRGLPDRDFLTIGIRKNYIVRLRGRSPSLSWRCLSWRSGRFRCLG